MRSNPSLGFVTTHNHPLFDSLSFAADRGFDHLEVKMNGDGHRRYLQGEEDAIRRELDAGELDLFVHLPYILDIGSNHEHVRDGSCRELEACLEQAAALDAQKAVVHAESLAWRGDELVDNVLESLVRLEDYASALDIELCAENPLRGTIPVPSFDQVFETTDVSMTLDTGHARCDGLSSRDIAAFVADNADRISHMHLNETAGESDDHLPFGEGTIDFEAIFAALPDDWDGTLSLEIKTQGFEPIGESKRRLENLLAE
ncbi:sugar phosphate isomerase/epimerase family protein [Haloarchaeobius sp. TZWSO28]|uniref:sugar phosphate isomerase/epimerase family protein n=1 Tax=Haloarchaeobius sp. TZWSO28 TaxID=3446119 RepID=UPI003EC00B1F